MGLETNLAAIVSGELFRSLQKNSKYYPDGHYPVQILASLDTKCLVWDCETSTLSCQALNQELEIIQAIVLTNIPHFSVWGIELNAEKTVACVYGKDGVTVVELPDLITSNIRMRNAAKTVGAKSIALGEKTFLRNSSLQVMQVKWHPGSLTDSHVSVLTSDSAIRTYDMLHPDQPPVTVSIGRKSGFGNGGFPSLRSVGEVAVAFDFGPPLGDPEQGQDLGWPVFVLFGNGAVYTFISSFTRKRDHRPLIHGPLPMRPQCDDNYEGSYCDILCLHSQPPTLALATSDLSVYHCMLLSETGGEDPEEHFEVNRSGRERSDSGLSSSQADFPDESPSQYLHVFECVTFSTDIGVDTEGSIEDEEFTVRFFRDRFSKFRYFVSHRSGVHGVSLPSLVQLSHSVMANEQPDFTVLQHPSVAEYMLCTQISGQEPAAPLALTILESSPLKLIVLTRDFQAHVIPVSLNLQLGRTETPFEEVLKPDGKPEFEIDFFSERIKQLLQKKSVQPRLHLTGEQSMAVDAQIQLVTRSRDVFWKEYISRLSLASEEVERRSELLRNRLMAQKEELTLFEGTKMELQREAELIAEQYEDLKEKQEQFEKRLVRLLSLVQQSGSARTGGDVEMKRRLYSVEADLPKIDTELQKLKQAISRRAPGILGRTSCAVTKAELTERQAISIKDTLQTQSLEIREIMGKMSEIRENLISAEDRY